MQSFKVNVWKEDPFMRPVQVLLYWLSDYNDYNKSKDVRRN